MNLRSRNKSFGETSANNKLDVGTYVWAGMNKTFWAAIIVSHRDVNFKSPNKEKSWVFWFGDYRVSEIKNSQIIDFRTNFSIFSNNYKKMSRTWRSGVMEAIREIGLPKTAEFSEKELVGWAKTEMPQVKHSGLTNFVKEKLDHIRNVNKADDEVYSKNCTNYEIRQMILDFKKGETSALKICLGCYTSVIVDNHPIFEGFICENCKEKLRFSFHVVEDNAKRYCTICGCAGKMVTCGNRTCKFVYCYQCVDDLCEQDARQDILERDEWLCFTCNENTKYKGLLSVRKNWKDYLAALLSNTTVKGLPQYPNEKNPIRVLSIFDCISSGLTSLIRLNIKVDMYFSCEIETESVAIVKKNYPEQVKFLGCVLNLREEDIKRILPIDLLLVGSPNMEQSLLNPYRKDVHDKDGIGIVFGEFHRVMNIIQMYNGRPIFWMFDHYGSMSIQRRVTISRFLKGGPQFFDAHTALCNKTVLVWTNIPSPQKLSIKDESENNNSNRLPNDQESSEDVPKYTFDISSIDDIETELGFAAGYTNAVGVPVYSRLKILHRSSNVKFLAERLITLQDYFEC